MSDPLIEGMTLIYAGKRHTVFEVPALLNATVLNIGEMMADLADVLHDAGMILVWVQPPTSPPAPPVVMPRIVVRRLHDARASQ